MILLNRLVIRNFKQLENVTLCFPQNGAILIEGHNEAGKSSLFEAVYFALFGKSLIRDQWYHIEHLRRYGAEDETLAQLDFSIEGRRFQVTRRITMGGQQRVELVCPAPQEAEADDKLIGETIRSARAANERLQEELQIGPESLLNTCFVEQKKLDNLEGTDPATRKSLINELLNLRVLTQMSGEFRDSKAAQAEAADAEKRVRVAQFDADLPELERARDAAWQGWRFGLLAHTVVERIRLEGATTARRARQEQIAGERGQVAKGLERCSVLREQIRIIESDIAHRIEAWRKAQQAEAQGAADLERRATQADGLPTRAAQLEDWSALLAQIVERERLQGAAQSLQTQRSDAQKRLDSYDALQSEWEQGETERAQAEDALTRRSAARDEAEAQWQARQQADRRDGIAATLLQHLDIACVASKEATSLQSRIEASQSRIAELPALREQFDRLQAAQNTLRDRDATERELERVNEALQDLAQKQNEAAARQNRIAALDAELAELAVTLAAREAESQACKLEWETGRTRDLLAAWIEAQALQQEQSERSARLARLDAGIGGAQERWTANAEAVTRWKRQTWSGYALAGAGIGIGIVGTISHGPVWMGTGTTLLALGGMQSGRAWREASQALKAQAGAGTERAALEGERRAVEQGIAVTGTAAAGTRASAEARQAHIAAQLTALGQTVPANGDAARIALAALPNRITGEAEAAWRQADSEMHNVQNRRNAAVGERQQEMARAASADPTSLAQKQRQCEQSASELKTRIGQAAAVYQTLRDENVNETELSDALRQIQTDIAEREARQSDLPQWEREAAEKTARAEVEGEKARTRAAELSLPDNSALAWENAARAERARLAQESAALPDATLQTRTRNLQTEAETAANRVSGLAAVQASRRSNLDAVSRPEIVGERDGFDAALVENADSQATLAPARDVARQVGLPTESLGLRSHLDALRANWERDAKEAKTLPGLRRAQDERARESRLKSEEFGKTWQTLTWQTPPDRSRSRNYRIRCASRCLATGRERARRSGAAKPR